MDSEPNQPALTSEEALRAAALLGEQVSLPVLVEAGVDPADLDPLFDEGALVSEGPTKARFADPERRRAELEGLPWSQRRRLSARIARALAKRRAPAEEVAEHFLNAQDFVQARSYLVKAAEKKCFINEYREALRLLRKAFDLWPVDEDAELRKKLLREMGRCALNTNDLETGRLAWEELAEMAKLDGDLRRQVEANRQLGALALQRPDRVDARSRLEEAARLSSRLGDPEEEARNWFSYAGFLADTVRLKAALEALETALAAAERCGDVALISEAIALKALVLSMLGRAEEATKSIEEAITLAIENELPEQIAIAYRRKANVREYSGDYVGYRDLELESLERCRIDGRESLESSCLSCVSYAFFRLGQWRRSLEAIREAIESKKVEGELLALATSVKGCITAFRGERKQASELLSEALRQIARHGGTVVEFYVYWAQGILAGMDGEADRAREAYRSLIALWRETDDRKDAVPGVMSAAAYFADESDSESLAACIDILGAISNENATFETKAAWRAALAEDHWMRGEVDKAIELESHALEGYRKQGLPIEIALVGRRLGLMLASKEDFSGAEKAWSESMEIARELGMRPLLDCLEKDRASTGLTSANATSAERAGLTPRQLDVLRLVARGLTNKEAAAELSLSPRTVEMHVASVLERLNCRARTDAIKKAAELGLV